MRILKNHKLLDFLREQNEMKSDADLCRALDVKPPVLSKIRAGKMRISAAMQIRIHQKTGMSIDDIQKLLGEQ